MIEDRFVDLFARNSGLRKGSPTSTDLLLGQDVARELLTAVLGLAWRSRAQNHEIV